MIAICNSGVSLQAHCSIYFLDLLMFLLFNFLVFIYRHPQLYHYKIHTVSLKQRYFIIHDLINLPEVGSSRKMTLGRLSNCRAIARRFF